MEMVVRTRPAVPERTSTHGRDTFTIMGPNTLKIESDGVEHLEVDVPEGETYTVLLRIDIDIE